MAPLEGVRILAVEVYGAGPFGSAHLADLGAEVIKIEPRDGGDMSRSVGPYVLGDDDAHFFQSLNRNKKSLDARPQASARPRGVSQAGRDRRRRDGQFARRPAGQARAYAMKSFRKANPRIVCAHLSAYGRDGRAQGLARLRLPDAGRGGLARRSPGEPDGPPARMGLSVVDYSTGTTCALALLAGILEARRTGKGRDLDVSLYDVAMHQLNYPGRLVPERGPGDRPRAALGASRTSRPRSSTARGTAGSSSWRRRSASGSCCARSWAVLSCLQVLIFWICLLDRKNRDELTRVLDAEFAKQKTEYWLENLRGTVPCGPVYDMAQALRESVLPRARRRAGVRPSGPARLQAGGEPVPHRRAAAGAAGAQARPAYRGAARGAGYSAPDIAS